MNRVVAEAQQQGYWLERWHIDLNALMQKPGAEEFRAFVRAVRVVTRKLIVIRNKLLRRS
jgi:hypothetical protein